MFSWLLPSQDIRLLNAGKPAQHTAEVERELDKADNMIRLLFNDVQILKDGRHPQAEQMYRRWMPAPFSTKHTGVTKLFKDQNIDAEKFKRDFLSLLLSPGFTASMSAL